MLVKDGDPVRKVRVERSKKLELSCQVEPDKTAQVSCQVVLSSFLSSRAWQDRVSLINGNRAATYCILHCVVCILSPHKNTCAISRGIQKSYNVVVTSAEVVSVQFWAYGFSFYCTFLLQWLQGWLLVLVGWLGRQLSNCVIKHLSPLMLFIYPKDNQDL